MRAIPCVVGLVLLAGVATAQPATDKPDYARAAEIYKDAEAAMAAARFDDAATGYQAAYDITKDPVLFYKIASAYQKGGKCAQAVPFYKRYLAEGKPSPEHAQLATDQVAACEKAAPPPPPPRPAGATARDRQDADDAADASSTRASATGSGMSKARGAAWISLGIGIAFGTVAVVSAMAVEAAEKDLDDLYDTRLNGRPVPFTDEIPDRYQTLIDQGERYQTISRVTFAAAGACLIGAGVLFWLSWDRDSTEAPPVSIHAGPNGGGISTTWRF